MIRTTTQEPQSRSVSTNNFFNILHASGHVINKLIQRSFRFNEYKNKQKRRVKRPGERKKFITMKKLLFTIFDRLIIT